MTDNFDKALHILFDIYQEPDRLLYIPGAYHCDRLLYILIELRG